jgi:N-acyl-D-aspartate/D-glutamate deacylase
MTTQWDVLISGAKVFDGTGSLPTIQDVAVKDGRVIARGENLPREIAADVINAEGRWLIPGMLDIHTHLDLEVDLEPGLPEVVRHGTTTVLVGNCSLGTCFGRQESDGQEPIVDCFTRVENIPKSVLRKCADTLTWDNTGDYLDHFKQIPLGPNVAAFVPHSMLRIEAMGLENSISRAPTRAELEKMESLLEEAMGQGYVGMSTDGLPFHYLSNDPNTEKRIPTQFASFGELKRLLSVVRRHDRVWQTTPIIENRLKAFLYFTLTSGRLFGKTLKTSALSAMEMTAAPKLSRTLLKFAKLMNSWLFKGDMHFQALGTNFRVWSDGIVSPLFEEMSSTSQLIAKEYDDVEGRLALLNDPAWEAEFRREWMHGRTGGDFASWKTRMGIPDNLVIRDPSLLIFDGAPVSEWDGESFEKVTARLNRYRAGELPLARSDQEREVFDSFPAIHTDEPGFILHLLRRYDRHFRFYADVGNQGNRATLELLLGEDTLPGFNDSGAHITNMAFFDANLMSLKLAKQQDEATVAQMVHRLTRKPAEVFGLDAGSLEIGARADLVLLNPDSLDAWEPDKTRELVHREVFDHAQMVNRSEGIVEQVWIAGTSAWEAGAAAPALGTKPLGQALRAA